MISFPNRQELMHYSCLCCKLGYAALAFSRIIRSVPTPRNFKCGSTVKVTFTGNSCTPACSPNNSWADIDEYLRSPYWACSIAVWSASCFLLFCFFFYKCVNFPKFHFTCNLENSSITIPAFNASLSVMSRENGHSVNNYAMLSSWNEENWA